MLKPIPLANALALAMALIYLLLWILSVFTPSFFKAVLNAQLLGGDVAGLIPDHQSVFASLIHIFLVALTYWIMGYFIAVIYNRFSK